MSSKPSSDPWRYRCPNGHTWVRSNVMTDKDGTEAEVKYHCRTCGWSGDHLVDQKAGRNV